MTEATHNQLNEPETTHVSDADAFKGFLQWAGDFCSNYGIFQGQIFGTTVSTVNSTERVEVLMRIANHLYDLWDGENMPSGFQMSPGWLLKEASGLREDADEPPVIFEYQPPIG